MMRLRIRRFRCAECHSYHNELPDCLVPYKHYETEVIAGVLDECVPCSKGMRRIPPMQSD